MGSWAQRLLAATMVAGIFSPAVAYAQARDPELETLLRDALEARRAAQEALKKADAALNAIQTRIGQTEVDAKPAPAPRLPRPVDMAVAGYGTPQPVPAKTATAIGGKEDCAAANVADLAVAAPNQFVWHCLNMGSRADYKPEYQALQFGASAADKTVELAPSYTIRRAGERAASLKVTPSVFVQESDSTKGLGIIHNFDEAIAGYGFGLAAEFRLFGARKPAERKKFFVDAIEKAKKDCVREHIVELAATPGATMTCSDSQLVDWMHKHGKDIWTETAGKLYDVAARNPVLVVGGSARFSTDKPRFLTPAIIAAIPGNASIADVKALREDKRVHPLTLKGYVGTTLFPFKDGTEETGAKPGFFDELGLGGVVSLTYKRTWETDAAAKGQTVCRSAGNLDQCAALDLVAPVRTATWIPAVSFNLAHGDFGLLPAFGIGSRFSFETNGDRFGVEVPVYLAFGKKDELNAGFKYYYRESGVSDQGVELKRQHGVGFFVGTTFSLGSEN